MPLNKKIQFKRVVADACSWLPILQRRSSKFLYCAGLVFLAPQTAHERPDQTHAVSAAVAMGGYLENHAPLPSDDDAMQIQAKYLRDKAELQKSIKACGDHPASCDPNVKEFSDMLTKVGRIKGRIQQVLIVNAWINLRYKYDDDEAASNKTDIDHRSLLQAITDGLGMCDEIARLKLFVLETLDFDPRTDVRAVTEYMYDKTHSEYCSGHMVVEVRVNNRMWAMDNAVDLTERTNTTDVLFHTLDASTIEPASVQLNFSNNSMWKMPLMYVPQYEFSSVQVGYYSGDNPKKNWGTVPKQALGAVAETIRLAEDTFYAVHANEIMAPVFAPHPMAKTQTQFHPAPEGDDDSCDLTPLDGRPAETSTATPAAYNR